MHNPKKVLLPGTPIRVEVNAVVIDQPNRENPYYYEVEFASDGHRETVSVGRITWVAEKPSAVFDQQDGSVTIFSSKLSPTGAVELFHWLRTHLGELTDAVAPVPPAEENEV